jgi:adenylylsulfate kinase
MTAHQLNHTFNPNPSGFVVWFYGLPSSGKSTLAQTTLSWCAENHHPCLGLDGDALRSGMCSDLGFSADDRAENVRRTAHMAKLAMEAGLAVIVSLVTPTRSLRDLIASIIPSDHLLIVGIECSLAECQRRDVKGLYAKAAAGLMKGMTGMDGTFEGPCEAEFRIKTAEHSVNQCRAQVLAELTRRRLIQQPRLHQNRTHSTVHA